MMKPKNITSFTYKKLSPVMYVIKFIVMNFHEKKNKSLIPTYLYIVFQDVLRLIAEPGSTYASSKKKTEVSCFSNGKVTNHNFCDVCCGGGEVVCCDKCQKSYHIRCQ